MFRAPQSSAAPFLCGGERAPRPTEQHRTLASPFGRGGRAQRGRRGSTLKTCRCRHVKKICQWHIFSVDLSGYAVVASILVCTASSFSPDLGSYAAVASIRTYTALSWIPSQSPTVTALPKGEPRVCTPPLPHTINKRRITPMARTGRYEIDMCSGKLLPKILTFALPLM